MRFLIRRKFGNHQSVVAAVPTAATSALATHCTSLSTAKGSQGGAASPEHDLNFYGGDTGYILHSQLPSTAKPDTHRKHYRTSLARTDLVHRSDTTAVICRPVHRLRSHSTCCKLREPGCMGASLPIAPTYSRSRCQQVPRVVTRDSHLPECYQDTKCHSERHHDICKSELARLLDRPFSTSTNGNRGNRGRISADPQAMEG